MKNQNKPDIWNHVNKKPDVWEKRCFNKLSPQNLSTNENNDNKESLENSSIETSENKNSSENSSKEYVPLEYDSMAYDKSIDTEVGFQQKNRKLLFLILICLVVVVALLVILAFVFHRSIDDSDSFDTETNTLSTTIVSKTTVPETTQTINEVDYTLYYSVLQEYISEAKLSEINNSKYIGYYCLYDIDDNGVYELIVQIETDSEYTTCYFYSLDKNNYQVDIGFISIDFDELIEKDGEIYLKKLHDDKFEIQKITLKSESEKNEVVLGNKITAKDFSGKKIESYDLDDASGLEKICSTSGKIISDVTVSGYIRAKYVENDDYGYMSGLSFNYRLYLSGDYERVSVALIKDGTVYFDSAKEYSSNETKDYINLGTGTDLLKNYSSDFAGPGQCIYISDLVDHYGYCVIPYDKDGISGDAVKISFPDVCDYVYSDLGVSTYKGEISVSEGSTVYGYTTKYVVYGEEKTVQKEVKDSWHITAKNCCYNYGNTYYELWDSDDNDYYGWVDSKYIKFYPGGTTATTKITTSITTTTTTIKATVATTEVPPAPLVEPPTDISSDAEDEYSENYTNDNADVFYEFPY